MKDKYYISDSRSLKNWAFGLSIFGIILTIILWVIGHQNWVEHIVDYENSYESYRSTMYFNEKTTYLAYIVGAIGIGLVVVFVAIILWIVYSIQEHLNKSNTRKNYFHKLETIENNENYGQEFKSKYYSLNDIFRNKIISNTQYEEKKQALIKEYESKIDLLEIQRLREVEIEKLKAAHRSKVLSDGEYEELLKKLESNKTGLNMGKVEKLISRATKLYEDKSFSECIALLNSALEKDNNNMSCLSLRANALYENGKYIDSKNDYLKLIKQGRFNSEYYYHLGNIEMKLGNMDLAIENWSKSKSKGYIEAGVQLDFYHNFENKNFLEESETCLKLLGQKNEKYFTLFGSIKHIDGLPHLKKESKPIIHLYEKGINIEFRTFVSAVKYESTYFDIAFSEIREINKFKGALFEFDLKDNKKIQFKYSEREDWGDNFQTFWNRLKLELNS